MKKMAGFHGKFVGMDPAANVGMAYISEILSRWVVHSTRPAPPLGLDPL